MGRVWRVADVKNKFLGAFLLILLGLSLVGNIAPKAQDGIIDAYASAPYLPSDGDAWTENNNATYSWQVSPSYKDTIVFTTAKAQVGSYSLLVNHTSATTIASFTVEIGASTDFSNYAVFVFWVYIAKASYSGTGTFYAWASDRFSGSNYQLDCVKNIGTSDCNRWIKFVLPKAAFRENSNPAWTNRRYFGFQFTGLTASDYTCIYIDGLRAETNYEFYDNSNSVDETVLPNLLGFIQREEKTVVYNDVTYTSLRSIKALNGSYQYETLESEVLAQTVFAYCLAYNYSQHEFLLDEAKEYATWLLEFQHDTKKGFSKYFNNSTKTFGNVANAVYNGWVLAGLSLLYNFWNDATLKQAIEDARGFWIDTMWDASDNWFDQEYNMVTSSKTDELSWNAMRQGAMMCGLAAYYKYVTQNSTVLATLNSLCNKGITLQLTSMNRFIFNYPNQWEDNIYSYWGYYFAYLATRNATYLTTFQKLKAFSFANNMLSTNASMYYLIILGSSRTKGFDGWGWACALPLWLVLNDFETDANLVNLYEQAIWDLLPDLLTNDYCIPMRMIGTTSDWTNQQYLPSNAFLYASLAIYYDLIYQPTNPYLISATRQITATSYANSQLTFTVSAFTGITSATKVYCGDKGEPMWIHVSNGSLSWYYNASTSLLELEVSHIGNAQIITDWRTSGDVNGDGEVDASDLTALCEAYGSTPDSAKWNENCDFNCDQLVDTFDLYLLGSNYRG